MIYYDPEHSLVLSEVAEPFDYGVEQGKYVHSLIFETIKNTGAQSWISNLRLLEDVKPEAEDWRQNYWFPKLEKETNLLSMAIILPDSNGLAMMQVKESIDCVANRGFDVRLFINYKEAKAWAKVSTLSEKRNY